LRWIKCIRGHTKKHTFSSVPPVGAWARPPGAAQRGRTLNFVYQSVSSYNNYKHKLRQKPWAYETLNAMTVQMSNNTASFNEIVSIQMLAMLRYLGISYNGAIILRSLIACNFINDSVRKWIPWLLYRHVSNKR
jgi:hypothetical protein